MAFSFPLAFLLLLSTVSSSAAAAAAAPPSSGNASIYDILPLYGLPPGIFPDSVTSFSLSSDGALSLNLSAPCYLDLDYLIYYAPSVTGCLRYGSLTALSGIQARRFLIWFDVDRIKVDLPPADYIYFDVGWITRKLGIDQFFTIHSCKSSCRLTSTIFQSFQWTKDFFANLYW